MDLTTAIVLSLIFGALSAAVGIYLMRYNASITEMNGMMVGMTMGMLVGITTGFLIGAATDMFVSNLVGVTVGLAFGAVFGRAGGLMGSMDGSMGGFMGGMMGAMLGVMVNTSAMTVWVTAAFTTLICLVLYFGLIRLVRTASVARYARDPVCDMRVNTATGRLTSSYQGATLYFCAASCQRAFDMDPERYLGHSPRQGQHPAESTMPA